MSDIFDLFRKIETQPTLKTPITRILCGLGNPGDKYLHNRHNIGFICMDYISQKLNIKITRARFSALCGECVIGGEGVLLLKPQTYMNESGIAVREAADFYKIAPENITVISDDISLPPGRMRIRRKGSAGGQKGLKSIIYHLGSEEFPRIRLGVGSPPEGFDLADWVLGDIPKSDQEAVFRCIENVLPAAELIVKGDFETAMSTYNGI
ncbi:MAG: aminoacyl-tRNA hydrolase [Clostridiales bacterium]|nr:aminoacyl-tRNA hydrolase [Clostridiales bacterium]